MDMNKFFYDLDQLLSNKQFDEAEEYMKQGLPATQKEFRSMKRLWN